MDQMIWALDHLPACSIFYDLDKDKVVEDRPSDRSPYRPARQTAMNHHQSFYLISSHLIVSPPSDVQYPHPGQSQGQVSVSAAPTRAA